MNTEEPKCGDDCKLVEMLATKTSKEQALENAIAAVLTGNISQSGAAKWFGVKQQTLSDRLKKVRGDATGSGNHTTQESKPARKKPTDEERQEWWRLHTEEGLTANAIHKKTGRNRETITKEIKRRKEAEAEPESTPTSPPAPSKKVASPPKHLCETLDDQTPYIKNRLLPLVRELVAVTKKVVVEQKRLHGAWCKDNLVFSTHYQECVQFCDERETFAEFAQLFDDPTVKTYDDVLRSTEVMFRRGSERMHSIRYATGCIPDPHKRELERS